MELRISQQQQALLILGKMPWKDNNEETCSILPMWLLCDEALVSCPQRDTIQTVSSSALLHMLCRSLSRILGEKKKREDKTSSVVSHIYITGTLRCASCLAYAGANKLPKLWLGSQRWSIRVTPEITKLESTEL